MSDASDYYSDSTESDEEEESFQVPNKISLSINAAKKFGTYIEDESEVEDSEPDDADQDADEVYDEQDGGRIKDILDEDIPDEDIPDEDDNDNSSDNEFEIEEEEKEKGDESNYIKTKKTTQQLIIDHDDDEDEDEYDENYLQKFDNQINRNYIEEFHPECLNHNSDEVSKLSRVIRDDNNIIIDPLHRTLPHLTKYEKARLLGQRAKQIETGSKPFVKVPENIIDSYVIAELELREKKIPFIIKRPIPGGAFEYWNLKDLEIINF
jgi:DNA-directed RNA polymerase subunit K/omega